MKLCKLKLKNLNSFREEVEIDFEKPPLDEASLVAITGPTGAGKTTLLDAICVSLYGKTPRLSGNKNQHASHLISHGEKDSSAEIEFLVNSTRYLATWSIRRKRSPSVQLYNLDDDLTISEKFSNKGKSLNANEKTVSEAVRSILGLDYDAFRRSVMLAQGEFAAFLKAEKDHRRAILEATAGIHVYDTLREKLNDKVNAVTDNFEEVNKKLEKVGEVSHEIVDEEKEKLDELQIESKKLEKSQRKIQKDKEKETKRKEHYEELQQVENQLDQLKNQQEDINGLKLELDRANKANQLLTEKQSFDNAKSENNSAKESLQQAFTELEETKTFKKNHQKDFEKKNKDYTKTYENKDQKMRIYNDAKTELDRAAERFDEVEKRKPDLANLEKDIDTSSNKMKKDLKRQDKLIEEITNTEDFLKQNPLPSDRSSRLNKLTRIHEQLNSQEKQLMEKTEIESEHKAKIKEINQTIKEHTGKLDKLKTEETELSKSLNELEQKYKSLQDAGSLEDWQTQRDDARKAQPIAQKYETLTGQLHNEQDDLKSYQESLNGIAESLGEIEDQIKLQTQFCKRADAEVDKLEAEKQIAILSDPVNQLRQQLEEGVPCRVCGSIEHPHKDRVELDSQEILKDIESKLEDAVKKASKEEKEQQKLDRQKARYQQDHSNTSEQIDACNDEIAALNSDIDDTRTKWNEIYEDTDVSSDWVNEQYQIADTSINDLNTARDLYNDAITDRNSVSQKRESCERDITREKRTLKDTKQRLESVDSDIEEISADVSAIKESFWESMPETFYGTSPDKSLKQFGEKITAVDENERILNTKSNQRDVLKTEIKSNAERFDDLKKQHEQVTTEIEHYQGEGDAFIQSVREKTDGLENEDQIDAAIKKLEAELKTKEEARNKAEQALQESTQLLTQNETTHKLCKERLQQCKVVFDEASKVFQVKLDEVGFESPETHESAIRDQNQIDEMTRKTNEYANENKQLTSSINELKKHFVASEYDPEELDRIAEKENEIETLTTEKQQEIGAQQKTINDLNDALKQREDIEGDLNEAKEEMERWKRLQETIPANTLRDFALEIIFKQMGVIANEQLRFLTSDRYQLKVESIGELAVIDRWNANEERPVETLSGGESFLTSLALALALSELSQGRAQLNSLFLDEGFGTLDAETLDIAIASLEGLQMQGRRIYLISHVQELTRRLPVKIKVRKRGDGSSFIEKS